MFKGFLLAAIVSVSLTLLAENRGEAQFRRCRYPAAAYAGSGMPAGMPATAMPASPNPGIIAYASGTAYSMGYSPVVSPFPTYSVTPFFGAVPFFGGAAPGYFNGRPVAYPPLSK